MTKAYVFPGQGSQFSGMGKDLYDQHSAAKDLFHKANDLLGFDITKIMFEGSDEELKATKVTQPAIFLDSVIRYKVLINEKPTMVAGHSLGEFSALVANETLAFEDALILVSKRALAMQKACELQASTMAAVLGLEDEKVEQICQSISPEIVVAANYNCPGQLVISGSVEGVTIACEKLKEAGARRALLLPVAGGFHSPLMQPAQAELEAAIMSTRFSTPICAVYQNVNAAPSTNPDEIKQNLITQLTGAVRWTQSVQRMVADGATHFTEIGPGKVLQGLIKKIAPEAEVSGI